jgi:hypothetical protein
MRKGDRCHKCRRMSDEPLSLKPVPGEFTLLLRRAAVAMPPPPIE